MIRAKRVNKKKILIYKKDNFFEKLTWAKRGKPANYDIHATVICLAYGTIKPGWNSFIYMTYTLKYSMYLFDQFYKQIRLFCISRGLAFSSGIKFIADNLINLEIYMNPSLMLW